MTIHKKRKKLYGVGVNDSTYLTREVDQVEGKQVTLWECPFYKKWKDVLTRGYSESYKKRRKTYSDCTVCEEWLTFSNFKAWMERQDWEGKHLDKDLLVKGNKHYSPSTCVFVHPVVNNFLTENRSNKGAYPTGVHKWRGRYAAQCSNWKNPDKRFIGYFDTPEEAHVAWRLRKEELSIELSESAYVNDPVVAKALIDRYKINPSPQGDVLVGGFKELKESLK